MKRRHTYSILLLFLVVSFLSGSDVTKERKLCVSEFVHPSSKYYPETWYHFIGGNVSKEGITADLEAIVRAGISGVQLFHGQFGGAWPGVSPQIQTLSEEWDDLVQWTAKECKRLHLTFTMQNCPGWSYAGGPWIAPENSMRHLTYSRTDLSGGKQTSIVLEKPASSGEEWRNYKDLFVIAFPTPEGDTGKRLMPERVTSNRSKLNFEQCLADRQGVVIPSTTGAPTIIEIAFPEETTLRTVEFPPVNSFSHEWCYAPGISVTLYAFTSGGRVPIAHIEMPASNWQDDQPITIACTEVPSKRYTVEISNLHEMSLAYLHLYSAARQQNWESEAAWTLRRIVREAYPVQSEQSRVDREKMIDLTEKMDSSGLLQCELPEGEWTLLRIGHVNTGQKNGPAPPEATGWEATKLNKSGVRANFNGYIGRLVGEKGVLEEGLLQGLLLDSWECKTQTWTDSLDLIFKKKRGYSLHSMFPALFGYVVESPVLTARFLRDWRVTLNELLVENFFGEIHHLAGQHDLKVSFETASGDVFPGDILEYYKYADIPMCEIWHPRSDSFVGSIEFKPVKPCVSAARMYGKSRVAAEAFTSFNLTWNEHPGFLKDIADDHFAKGVTHLVFHTYTHNPRTDFLPPGSSFGAKIGTPFLRLQTWWEHMPYFTDYLARCNYMLEEGEPVSDVLMYLGDELNHKPPQLLPFPEGYSYDYCNPDALLHRLSMRDATISTPEGIRYRVMWLYDCERMVPETLEKMLSMVEQGMILVGRIPSGPASLSGGEEAQKRYERVVERLWGDGAGPVRGIGKGRVYNTADIGLALDAENIKRDISVDRADLRWLHRQSEGEEIYFLSAYPERGFKGEISFRGVGEAEVWDPLTGGIVKVDAIVQGDFTRMELDIPPGGSCFVLLQKNTGDQLRKVRSKGTEKRRIDGPWQICFPPAWGINQTKLTVSALVPWKDLPFNDEGRSFSGTATYSTSFTMGELSDVNCYRLDLGAVGMIAKVKVNGRDAGTSWSSPHTLDISSCLMEGENVLEVAVTSTWFNRLVYDAGLPEEERKTWTIEGPDARSALKDYGLLGPVILSY